MTIAEQENKLFEKWAEQRPGLVQDGVIDEAAFLASSPKIMLILKEVNDKENDGWDLRDYLRGSPKGHTWNTVTRWVWGIRALPSILSWKQLAKKNGKTRKLSSNERVAAIRSLCVMNLKKTPGTGTSKMRAVQAIALGDKDYLRKQFLLYNPDLVVCCGTSKVFQNVLAEEIVEGSWSQTYRGIYYCKLRSGATMLEFFHPQVRWEASLVHYALIDAVAELFYDKICN